MSLEDLLQRDDFAPDVRARIRPEIDDQHRYCEALVDSERKARAIVENWPVGMHLARLAPDERLVLIGSNRAADAIRGVEHSQFVGKTIEEASPPLAGTELPGQYRRVRLTDQMAIDRSVEIFPAEDDPRDAEPKPVDFDRVADAVRDQGLHWLLLSGPPQ
jgi:hypothetical protein